MSSTLCLLRRLRNLNLPSTLGRVRPCIGQAVVQRYCSDLHDANISNIAKVAKEYTDIYGKKTVHVAEEKDPKDRSVPVPVDVSIRYLRSDAYRTTYGSDPVWVLYRRNFKGQRPPFRTRRTCIRYGRLSTNNPCPVCRDEYLVLHYKNVDLLKQFVDDISGAILPTVRTNLCQMQHENLLAAITESKELGLLPHDVPFRVYNYEHYKPKKSESN